MSHWEVGSAHNNKIHDEVELDEVKLTGVAVVPKRTQKKASRPKSKKCLLLYKNGEMVYWKETPCENGNTTK